MASMHNENRGYDSCAREQTHTNRHARAHAHKKRCKRGERQYANKPQLSDGINDI